MEKIAKDPMARRPIELRLRRKTWQRAADRRSDSTAAIAMAAMKPTTNGTRQIRSSEVPRPRMTPR